MATLATVGDYITECRTLLQDTDVPYRYSDAEIVRALNISLVETRRLRADLFLTLSMTAPSFATDPVVLTDVVPVDPMYRSSLVYYVVGRCQLRDGEESTDARASALMNKFVGQLLSSQS